MRVLVDTHVFFWWLTDDKKLSDLARRVITDENNEVMVSAVVAWELATKVRFFKWPEATDLAVNIDRIIAESGFTPLPITVAHARVAGLLAARHRDPFDRMLASQAQVETIPLLTVDPIFATAFNTQVLW
jgi:PIN domain nuclease of toxin-antitoxin system